MPFPQSPKHDALTALVTNFPNQGPVLRIIYPCPDGHIREISYVHDTGWGVFDLTTLTGAAPAIANHGPLLVYTTDFPNQGPVIRVLYMSNNNEILELYYVASSMSWGTANLTKQTNAPYLTNYVHTFPPRAYITDFPGQGPTIRLVFLDRLYGHIWELYYLSSDQQWRAANLTTLANAVKSRDNIVPYVTDFPGQGPVARIVYQGMDNHLHELYYLPSTQKWSVADLSILANLPVGGYISAAYVTDFPNQGPTARLVVMNGIPANFHIYELYYVASDPKWRSADLTVISGAGAGPADGTVIKQYMTDFPSEGPASRIVYRSSDNHIRELCYVASTEKWKALDLSHQTNSPEAADEYPVSVNRGEMQTLPIAFVTDFAAQGLTAHVVYVSKSDHHIWELFYEAGAGGWAANDLTNRTNAPETAPSLNSVGLNGPDIIHYSTNFDIEGPAVRLAFMSGEPDRPHLWELFTLAGSQYWRADDLSLQANAP